jgi:hypothetical protein
MEAELGQMMTLESLFTEVASIVIEQASNSLDPVVECM